jgi:hypothetical protein
MKRRAHKPDRRKANSFTLGWAAFARISAVEGVRMTAAMEEAFREWDRRGLSTEERRRIINRTYGKGPRPENGGGVR